MSHSEIPGQFERNFPKCSRAGWRVEVRFDRWTDGVVQTLFVYRRKFRW